MESKVTLKYLACLIPKLGVLVLLLEISFRLLIPACQAPQYLFDGKEGVLRFNTGKSRDGLYTFGSFAEIRARWHVNNMGWISERDYHESGKPVVAIIGDSFIEAYQVDPDRKLDSVLRAKLGGGYEVASFGMSGANLSQYLAISRYVHKTLHPKIMVFSIVDGDVDGSLLKSGNRRGYLYFKCETSGVKEVLLPRGNTGLREKVVDLLRKSALFRYVRFNSGFLLGRGMADGPSPAGSLRDGRVAEEVVGYAFERIRQENPGCAILILLDAPRLDIYKRDLGKDKVKTSSNPETRRILLSRAMQNGFHVVDLTGPMSQLYSRNHAKFNFPNNYHWNEYGQEVVAEQIFQEITHLK